MRVLSPPPRALSSSVRALSSLRRAWFPLVVTAFLAACQAPGPVKEAGGDAEAAREDARLAKIEVTRDSVEPAPPVDLWDRIRRGLHWRRDDHPAVRRARDAYLSQPRYLDVVGQRAQRYLFHIVEEVESRGMPLEVALLPMVESTLDPFAVSPQKAAGLWQIMPATAHYLGMHRDWWFDDRLDLRQSTRVALDYLEQLHAEFDGDWMLALAAYNAGKGRVSSARRRNASRGMPTDYWSLSLPRETQRYIPRLLALADIIRRTDELGVELPPVANAPAFVAVPTGGQIELQRAAQLAGVEIATLKSFNPGHLRWATSPERQEILLPELHARRFEQALASLSEEDRVSWAHYRIRSGDTLGGIARRMGTQVELLREVNGIRGHFIRAGDTLLIPGGNGEWSASLALVDAEKARRQTAYRVRRGDSLYRIANRFKVSIGDLVAWNRLDPNDYLRPGQELVLYPGGRDG